MENRKAIETLDTVIKEDELRPAVDTAIDALKRLEPENVIVLTPRNKICPKCKGTVRKCYKYCCSCGQALIWREK